MEKNLNFPKEEYLEREDQKRYSTFPIKHPDLYRLYKKQESNFWTDEDISKDLQRDRDDRNRAPEAQRKLFDIIQSFFAVSDGVVNETITERLLMRIKNPEYRMILIYQAAMEQVHGITYSKIIDAAVADTKERAKLFNAVEEDISVKKKVDWIHRYTGHENDTHYLDKDSLLAIKQLVNSYDNVLRAAHPYLSIKELNKYKPKHIKDLELKLKEPIPPLSKLIAANAIMEGVFFQWRFLAVIYLCKGGKFAGAGKANEQIQRDEGQHASSAAYVYKNYVVHKLSQEQMFAMLDEAVDIEIESAKKDIPDGLLGMNVKMVVQYIKFCADWLMMQMGYKKKYNVTNPFPFMEKQAIADRSSDFFKTEELGYAKHGLNETAADQEIIFDESSED